MREKSCCITGHRNLPNPQIPQIQKALWFEAECAVRDGFTHFISGFAEGVDLYFAAIIAHMKRANPTLSLEAAIPYSGRFLSLMNRPQTRALLAECNSIRVMSRQYAPNIYSIRNQYMVKSAERVIAVYDGRSRGGTLATMRMAQRQGKQLRIITVAELGRE